MTALGQTTQIERTLQFDTDFREIIVTNVHGKRSIRQRQI